MNRTTSLLKIVILSNWWNKIHSILFYSINTSLMIPSWFSWFSHKSYDQHMIFHDLHISTWSFACSGWWSPHDFIILMIPHGHDPLMILMILTRISWSPHDIRDLHMIRRILLWSLRCSHDRHEPYVNLKMWSYLVLLILYSWSSNVYSVTIHEIISVMRTKLFIRWALAIDWHINPGTNLYRLQ